MNFVFLIQSKGRNYHTRVELIGEKITMMRKLCVVRPILALGKLIKGLHL